jgi:hypothetical protein
LNLLTIEVARNRFWHGALVHVIEAFIAPVTTSLARGLALEAARRIGRSLGIRERTDPMFCVGPTVAGAWTRSLCLGVLFAHG